MSSVDAASSVSAEPVPKSSAGPACSGRTGRRPERSSKSGSGSRSSVGAVVSRPNQSSAGWLVGRDRRVGRHVRGQVLGHLDRRRVRVADDRLRDQVGGQVRMAVRGQVRLRIAVRARGIAIADEVGEHFVKRTRRSHVTTLGTRARGRRRGNPRRTPEAGCRPSPRPGASPYGQSPAAPCAWPAPPPAAGSSRPSLASSDCTWVRTVVIETLSWRAIARVFSPRTSSSRHCHSRSVRWAASRCDGRRVVRQPGRRRLGGGVVGQPGEPGQLVVDQLQPVTDARPGTPSSVRIDST